MATTRPRRFAEDTSVPADRSKQEITTLLRRHGAEKLGMMWERRDGRDIEVVAFELKGRPYTLFVRFPDPAKMTKTAYEQAVRTKWRLLLLWVKGQLEAIAEDLITADQAFHAFMLLPNGQTMEEYTAPQVADIIARKAMPGLLPGARLLLPPAKGE